METKLLIGINATILGKHKIKSCLGIFFLLFTSIIFSQTISTPGTGSIVIPANSYVTVEVWGAGGSGGDDGAKNTGFGGGGGGAYSFISFENLNETTYSYFVGAGGTHSNGENTYFNQSGPFHVEAGGGQSVAKGVTVGGLGGIVIAGTGANGGNGADGTPGSNGNGGGGGSSAGVALDGTPITGNNAIGILVVSLLMMEGLVLMELIPEIVEITPHRLELEEEVLIELIQEELKEEMEPMDKFELQ